MATDPTTPKKPAARKTPAKKSAAVKPARATQQEAIEDIIARVPLVDPETLTNPTEQPQNRYEAAQERAQALQDDFTNNPLRSAPERETHNWLIASLIANGIALLGIFVWEIPTWLFALAGLIFGIVSLRKNEQPHKWVMASTIAGGALLLGGIIIVISIILVLWVALFGTALAYHN
jgi:hypothetical protein